MRIITTVVQRPPSLRDLQSLHELDQLAAEFVRLCKLLDVEDADNGSDVLDAQAHSHQAVHLCVEAVAYQENPPELSILTVRVCDPQCVCDRLFCLCR